MPFLNIAKTFTYSLLGLTLFSNASIAQKTTLIKSTEQCWSGGMAGRHGCNYNFVIDFKGSKPIPDTLWVGDYPIELIERKEKPPTEGNMKIIRTRDKVRFDIAASTYFNDHIDPNGPMPPGEGPTTTKPVPPKKYKGVALLSYKIKGKKYYYPVAKIMQKEPHISYP